MAESRTALPVAAAYAALVGVSCFALGKALWLPAACVAVSAFLMMMLNNVHSLIRIFSRMISCSFLVLAVMCPWTLGDTGSAVVQLCYVLFFTFFMRAYQDKAAVGSVFYAFAMLGIASVFFNQILFFVPVLWIVLFANIMAGSWRTFCASILGLLTPYWFLAAIDIYNDDLDRLLQRLAGIDDFGRLADMAVLDEHQMVSAGVVVLLCLMGIIHFHRTSFKDKIQVRMYYEMFSLLSLLTIVFMVLQPQHCQVLQSMLLVSATPLIGHYIALTRTRLTNVSFVLMVVGIVAVTLYNLLGL